MGGMAVLEWPLCTPQSYVRNIIPIATSSRHSAWCISWGEAQRQSIYSDPLYLDGYYDVVNGQPKTGLAAARMAALLTYRSRDSFEKRFGRKTQVRKDDIGVMTPPRSPSTPAEHALAAHNDGHRSRSTASSDRSPAGLSSPISQTSIYPPFSNYCPHRILTIARCQPLLLQTYSSFSLQSSLLSRLWLLRSKSRLDLLYINHPTVPLRMLEYAD